ncbi:TPM domain-containing protein [Sphingomonas japonica]|uniref:Membrane protein n=1 Tax=Sphingomonas japonica TaxID=511662 RepID=A0ABX0TZ92_9SPHN|nr:TPM domain-containing protein [Sphingomonas japonica]NIJ23548.1 putative membrane protein [Sphingomonas japonica]
MHLTPQDHGRVTAAVAQAERTTDAEIVTIVADRSDAYHDVGLHYAVLAMLLLLGLAALVPGVIEAKLALLNRGWTGEVSPRAVLLVVLVAQATLFLVVRYALAWFPLRMAVTPRATKTRRVRRRAVQLFRASAEKRTATRIGVLLYLSLSEHVAEIVADEAIHAKVPPERWGEAMAALVDRVKAGDVAGGMVAAVEAIGAIVAEHFPKSEGDPNELPDRLIEL